MTPSDRELALRLKKGDELALNLLMDRYYVGLCSYAKTFFINVHQAEDVVQEVFVKLWIKRCAIDTEKSLRSFLFQTVHNLCIDYYRKQRNQKEFISAHHSLFVQVTQEPLDYWEEKKLMLKRGIQKLSPQCKKVFLLKHRDGLTYQEIANHLKISKKTVESHMTKAFKELKKIFSYQAILLLIWGGRNKEF